MDPNIRTAKRLENPGLLRFGMFVTATFHGCKKRCTPTVPMHGGTCT